jgi:hypothetical protein
VQAAREVLEHDDEERALGEAPKPDRVEAYSMWRSGWRALGRPEDTRAESEMSTGQLRVRERAAQREDTWAPHYVDHEMAGANLAAREHRERAALRRAEGKHDEADEADTMADMLGARADDLEEASNARAKWFAHTAETHAAADRARLALAERGEAVDGDPERAVTAEEWLEAHRAEQRVDERRRPVRETSEFVDVAERRERAKSEARGVEERLHHDDDSRAESTPVTETAVPDIREETEHETPEVRHEGDWTRVPSADETAASVDRARRALREMRSREAGDQAGDQPTRDATLRRWHADDERKATQTRDDEAPALTRF